MVHCVRCKRQGEALTDDLPLAENLQEEVRRQICKRCWQAWQEMEVIVINELRLNFIDPEAQDILRRRMREFLELEPTPGGEAAPPSGT